MIQSKEIKKSKTQVFGARLFSTVLLWAIVTGVFISGNVWLYLGLITLLGFCGVLEFFQMTSKGGMPSLPKWGCVWSAIYLVSLIGVLGTQGAAGLDTLFALDVLSLILLVMGGFAFQLRREVDGQKTVFEVAVTALGFIYVVVLFSFLARLLFLPEIESPVPGKWLIIWLVVVTKFADMGAYITGSLIGKHKMIPHISPGKTWQGFGGALVFSLIAGCGMFALLPESLAILSSWGWVIGLSLLLSLLAIVGDLAESVLKRSIGVKDSGKTLPGIGGALDLIDSICFTAPVLFFILRYLPLGS
ncbi:MAG: phosphatidate cytidylyltransferase [Akkermansiaceae bacterium]